MSDGVTLKSLNCCKCGNCTKKHTCVLCGHRLCENCSERPTSTRPVGRPKTSELSARELEVVRALAAGERSTDIAVRIHLSIKTVSTFRKRALEKLGIPQASNVALANLARERGLLEKAAA